MKAPAIVLLTGIAISLPVAAQKRYEEQTNRTEAPATSGEARQDARNAALTGKVKAALAGDVGLRTLRINVDSSGSIVTLKGVVDSDDTKRRAEQVAKQVEGVASVNNQLTVRTPG
jgi:hyperosmotically inducible protein